MALYPTMYAKENKPMKCKVLYLICTIKTRNDVTTSLTLLGLQLYFVVDWTVVMVLLILC